MAVKTIGVLTSGGDAPGMNAAVRSVVRTAKAKGLKVFGIRKGYVGLINDDVFEMDLRSVSDIIQRGGTMLYTARCREFETPEGVAKAVETCKKHNIDGCVVIGGDGSFRGARDLTAAGINCVGIPGTIDNDISCTDYTIGFDTAMDTNIQMIDRLRDTAQSHSRCTVCEVMGRHAGHLALHTGIAAGATAIVVPEILPFKDETKTTKVDFETTEDYKKMIEKIKTSEATGKCHFIVVVAEGVGRVSELAKCIEKDTGIESRATVFGHVQRGGSPTVRDRVEASAMGHKAVELLVNGEKNRVVALKDNKLVDYDITEALEMKKPFEMELYDMANEIGI